MPEKIFLISLAKGLLPGSSIHRKCNRYIRTEEAEGNEIYWPFRDEILSAEAADACRQRWHQMRNSNQLAICWSREFPQLTIDLGMALVLKFQFGKSLKVINPEDLELTNDESPDNFLMDIHERNSITDLRRRREQSNCGRSKVVAGIMSRGKIIAVGVNHCEAPDTKGCCQRKDLARSVSQELCGTKHAELMALLNIRQNRAAEDYELIKMPNRATAALVKKLFTLDERQKIWKARLLISGHYRTCESCWRWLRFFGINYIRYDDLYLNRYACTNLNPRL